MQGLTLSAFQYWKSASEKFSFFLSRSVTFRAPRVDNKNYKEDGVYNSSLALFRKLAQNGPMRDNWGPIRLDAFLADPAL
jgi:hypothetical protein